MIRHIVFFNARNPDDLDEIRAGLSMLAEIPYSTTFEIGTNVKTDRFDTGVDFVVYAEFEDEAALAAYRAHPIYQASTARVKPLRDLRVAADYVVETATRRRI